MFLLGSVFDNGLKWQNIEIDRFTVQNLVTCYLQLSRGKAEPTIIFVSKALSDFVIQLSELLPDTNHIKSKIWQRFRNASVVISGELEANQMFFMNLNKLDDEKYNALVTFIEEKA